MIRKLKYVSALNLILLAFSFSLLAFSSFAQGNSPFIKTFGLNGYYYGKDIIRCKDSTFIFVGSSDIDNWNNSDALIVRLDSNLNQTLWSRNVGGINVDWATGIVEDSDTTFIVCGYSNSYAANSDYDVRCLKISITGNIIWQKSYGGNDWDFAYHIKKLSDNNFLITGKSASNTFGKENAFAIKINSAGDTLWQKYYAVNNNSGFNKAIELSDSSLVFAGFIENELPHINKDGLVVATDKNGNFQWQQQYGDTLEDELMSVEKSKFQNVFWACGYTEGKSGWKGKESYLLKLDYNGSIYDQDTSGHSNEIVYSVIERADTNLMLMYNSVNAGFGNDVKFFKFSRDVYFMTGNSFGSTGKDFCYNLKLLSDDKFVAIGNTNSFTNSLSSVLIIFGNINQGGLSSASEINGVKETLKNKGNINVYPNPFKDATLIGFSEKIRSVDLYNSLGQIVDAKLYSITKGDFSTCNFQNLNLKSGIYYLKLNQNIPIKLVVIGD